MSNETGSSTAVAIDLAVPLARVPAQTGPAARHDVPSSSDNGRAQRAAPVDAHDGSAVEVLTRMQFLRQLSREKRRADRAKSELSLVVYTMAEDDADEASADMLLGVMRRNARDTDYLGVLGQGQVAALLPHTGSPGMQAFISKIDAQLQQARESIEITAATYPDHLFENIAAGDVEALDTQPLLLDDAQTTGSRSGYPLKRALDIVGATVGLLLLAPVMLAVGAAVALSSPGPIIFKQSRLGRRGVPFTFYKFRSMRVDSDDRIHREFVEKLIKGQHQQINQQDATQPHYKIKVDPRVTRIGAFIRRTSLDELPQFFNVLKGDMSLVGPRPPLPYEAKAYQPWHLRRVLELKPGITGPWQVYGRSRVTFDDMVRMDLQYVRQASVTLDLSLLLKTVVVVLKRDGAG